MFVILLILLTKLPKSGDTSALANSTVAPSGCVDVSSLNSSDAKAFWVSF